MTRNGINESYRRRIPPYATPNKEWYKRVVSLVTHHPDLQRVVSFVTHHSDLQRVVSFVTHHSDLQRVVSPVTHERAVCHRGPMTHERAVSTSGIPYDIWTSRFPCDTPLYSSLHLSTHDVLCFTILCWCRLYSSLHLSTHDATTRVVSPMILPSLHLSTHDATTRLKCTGSIVVHLPRDERALCSLLQVPRVSRQVH